MLSVGLLGVDAGHAIEPCDLLLHGHNLAQAQHAGVQGHLDAAVGLNRRQLCPRHPLALQPESRLLSHSFLLVQTDTWNCPCLKQHAMLDDTHPSYRPYRAWSKYSEGRIYTRHHS